MMKRFFIAAIALATTIPAAVSLKAQDDDDIYFSKKANKKATQEAIYGQTADYDWSTDANNDWDLDDYNRRGKEVAEPVETKTAATATANTSTEKVMEISPEPDFYYEVPDGNGGTTLVPGNKKILKKADASKYKVVRDTLVLVEQYYFSDLIRRFHNPFFGYYRYSPWYDVAFYDPFYWDYCYYDPWWYVTPSFGFHWGSWYGGWSFGYYSGWYGGWYSPFYHPMPHYHHFCYEDYHHGIWHEPAHRPVHHSAGRNNMGGHFENRGGWRRDGGSSRLASASTNRSYRAANGAHVGRANNNGSYNEGPTLRGRNATNGRINNSNMRNDNSTQSRFEQRSRYADSRSSSSMNNSSSRRESAGMRQTDNGRTRSERNSSFNRSNSSRQESYSNRSNNTRSESYSNRSNNSSYSRSSSSGMSHSSGGGFSGGGHSGGGGGSRGGGHGGRR